MTSPLLVKLYYNNIIIKNFCLLLGGGWTNRQLLKSYVCRTILERKRVSVFKKKKLIFFLASLLFSSIESNHLSKRSVFYFADRANNIWYVAFVFKKFHKIFSYWWSILYLLTLICLVLDISLSSSFSSSCCCWRGTARKHDTNAQLSSKYGSFIRWTFWGMTSSKLVGIRYI